MKYIKSLLVLLVIAGMQSVNAQNKKTMQWIGGPTYVLQLGSFKILTDPMLSPKGDSAFIIKQHPTTGQMNAPITRLIAPASFSLANIDLLLISHPHADHVDKQAIEKLDKDQHLVGPEENYSVFKNWGFKDINGLKWGDSTIMKKGTEVLKIIAVKTVHAANEPLHTALGNGNGYIIEYSAGDNYYRIYWTGDTVWFEEMNNYTSYGKIDLLIPDMGAVGSDGNLGRRGLNSEDCLHLANVLQPTSIIPVHHSTFSMYVEPVSVLKRTFSSAGFGDRLHILKTGATTKL
ncbi:MBL fold metallo-hydrolase [Chitinophaga sp. S165]|uniref:MBL fold metallo-hydrolase n=1 Tax=Chitinophaga sp. S165 TaxID=2135462 RepID=UPI000D71AE15|nr:MBL fold metallo-hydrolase [Chitinophaga sp. S165]PWV46477.1 L-ascorbate metabolism protein UlaG (beta-lactamase superfamily) [Chitinophaga sp. S165]